MMDELRKLEVTAWETDMFWVTPRHVSNVDEARQLVSLYPPVDTGSSQA